MPGAVSPSAPPLHATAIKKKAYTRRLTNALLRAYFKGFQVVGYIGGEQNRGTVGVEGVNSGQEMLDFFAYKHVSLGNCMCRRRKAAIAQGKKPVYLLGGMGERRKLLPRGLERSPRKRRNFEHFMPKWSAFSDVVNFLFCNNQIEKIVDERSFY